MKKALGRRRAPREVLTGAPESLTASAPNIANLIAARTAAFVEPARRTAMIAEGAYYRAERRGFDPGHELDDWLAAEAEIDQALAGRSPASLCGDELRPTGAIE
ncbi:MAG: DUF2934 domain-containing protein [Steroidobacteraceae bacterium]